MKNEMESQIKLALLSMTAHLVAAYHPADELALEIWTETVRYANDALFRNLRLLPRLDHESIPTYIAVANAAATLYAHAETPKSAKWAVEMAMNLYSTTKTASLPSLADAANP